MRILKKSLAFIVSISMLATLSACNSNDKDSSEQETIAETTEAITEELTTEEITEPPVEETTTQVKEYKLDDEYILEDITFKVSSEWTMTDNNGLLYWYADDDSFILADCNKYEHSEVDFDGYLVGIESSSDEVIEHKIIKIDDRYEAIKIECIIQDTRIILCAFVINNNLYSVGGTISNLNGDTFIGNSVESVINSIEVSDSIGEKEETDKENSKTDGDITLGMKNALSKAKDYLKYSAFSYTGLIDQLEYEGFTNEEATYGADKCGADWNEQAAKKAQQYIDYSSFSRQGLIDQLIYEGFTEDQAEYGVTAIGY